MSFFALGCLLLYRAVRDRFLNRFPLFYGYLIYLLVSGAVVTFQYYWAPTTYPDGAWFRLLLSFVVEFAVIVEISDHIFEPYPAIRRLGRVLTAGVCVGFFSVYLLPVVLHGESSRTLLIELVKRSSLTKAAVIVVLLAAVRQYRLPLGPNVAGLLLGFSLYLGCNVVNSALLEALGASVYGRTFGIVGPLSFTLAMIVWTVALWRYQPAVPAIRQPLQAGESISDRLTQQLDKLNTALIRLLEK